MEDLIKLNNELCGFINNNSNNEEKLSAYFSRFYEITGNQKENKPISINAEQLQLQIAEIIAKTHPDPFNIFATDNSKDFRGYLKECGWHGGNQGGRYGNKQFREPRSYKNQRVPQLLRHISRLIYYLLVSRNIKVVEIELMYWKKNNTLFVAANNTETINMLLNLAKSNDLGSLLLSDNSIENSYDNSVKNRTLKKFVAINYFNSSRSRKIAQENNSEFAIMKNIVNLLIPNARVFTVIVIPRLDRGIQEKL